MAAGTGPGSSGTGAGVTPDLGSATTLYPPAGSLLVDAGDAAHAATDDFNGTTRDAHPDVGAYERTTDANPGWTIIEGFKTPPVQPVTGDDPGTMPSKGGGCCDASGDPSGALVILLALARRRSSR